MKKKLLIIIALVFIGLVVVFIKFVGGVTSGNSVIKKYSYPGGVKEFISHVQSFSVKDSSVVSRMTDTTGTVQTGYAYYIEIELKNNGHDVLYSIVCESNSNSNSKASGTTIELVMAFDKINNIGGYNKEAKGVEPLVNNFDSNFLTPLRNSQNIKITPLEPN